MKYEREFLQQKGIPHLPGDWDFRSEAQQENWISENYPIIFIEIFEPENLINWSELSRFLAKGDRNGIRKNKCPEIYKQNVLKLIEAVKKWQASLK
jgi:hypothetical protein